MGKLIQSQIANPGAPGAGQATFYTNLTPRPCMVLPDGVEQVIPTMTAAGGLLPVLAGANALGAGANGFKELFLDYTNTATVGAVVINKASGRVNAAAAAVSVVVTNSLVTAASHVFCQLSTADATAQVLSVVSVAGSFTINLVAPTAQVSIDFFVVGAD